MLGILSEAATLQALGTSMGQDGFKYIFDMCNPRHILRHTGTLCLQFCMLYIFCPCECPEILSSSR